MVLFPFLPLAYHRQRALNRHAKKFKILNPPQANSIITYSFKFELCLFCQKFKILNLVPAIFN